MGEIDIEAKWVVFAKHDPGAQESSVEALHVPEDAERSGDAGSSKARDPRLEAAEV